jgi:glycosyltransferase involved in cell wall biosynthesis
MKISIITAVYNGDRDIAATLKSVADQNYDCIEHIVVDGASTDGTVEILRAHVGQIAVLISEPDRGVFDGFNKGIRAASGDAIGFLNCGDTFTVTDVISRIVAQFADDRIDAVFGDVLMVDALERTRVVRRYKSKYFTPHRMAYGLMPAHPTLYLRRRVYDRIGGYNPIFKIAGDFELCLRAFADRLVNYRYIPENLVCMPVGGLSNRGWRSKLQISREMKLACDLDGISTNMAKLCLRFPLKLLELL